MRILISLFIFVIGCQLQANELSLYMSKSSGKIRPLEDIGINKTMQTTNQDIWIDPETNLMWQNQKYNYLDKEYYDLNNEEGSKVGNHTYGVKYCKNLTLGSYSNWRLPSAAELRSLGCIRLFDYRTDGKGADRLSYTVKNSNKKISNSKGYEYFIKEVFIENMPPPNGRYSSTVFHTSTKAKTKELTLYYVDFFEGYGHYSKKGDNNYIRCVRNR